nr:hypothetical protein [Tanacetum cinerariifolium]
MYNSSSLMPHVEYAPTVYQQSKFFSPDTRLVVPVFQKGNDLINEINHMLSFLTSVVPLRYPSTNNQLRTSSNPHQQATINNERYMNESQYTTVHNSSSPTLQDDMILSKRILKEKNNVDNVAVSYEQSLEIKKLKHTLSEHLKEKESLEQMVILLTNDFQKEESRNIDRELALEKQVKELNNIVFKRNQSTQTIHMLTKPQFFYDHSTRQALGDVKFAKESRSKMIQKQNEPIMSEKKVNTKPVDYDALNQLSKDFKTRFVPQAELSAEQAFWSSMVNSSMKKLKFHLASFDMVIKERTTATAITEGTWGFEHTKACFRDDIIPFVKDLKELFSSFDQFLIDELTKVQNIFNQMEQAVEQHCVKKNKSQVKDTVILKLREKLQSLSGDVNKRKVKREIEEIETLNIELDHRVTKLVAENEHLKHMYKKLYDSIKPSRVRSKEQCDDLIKQVNLKSTKIFDLNASLQEKVLVITSFKESLSKLKGKDVFNKVVPLHSIDPELLEIDVAPLALKLLKNRTAHTDYIR